MVRRLRVERIIRGSNLGDREELDVVFLRGSDGQCLRDDNGHPKWRLATRQEVAQQRFETMKSLEG